MLTEELVDLSRLQFAVTALYHFLFVPLTIGLAVILVVALRVGHRAARPGGVLCP